MTTRFSRTIPIMIARDNGLMLYLPLGGLARRSRRAPA
jgi:hypothetical protein